MFRRGGYAGCRGICNLRCHRTFLQAVGIVFASSYVACQLFVSVSPNAATRKPTPPVIASANCALLLLFSMQSSGSRCRLLHVEIADATDSFFLYSFTVSESEYAEMASEQTLLVDFATFPSHLVSLLDACTPGRDASASSSLTTGSNAR